MELSLRGGKRVYYQRRHVLEFDATRKRMSVIVEDQSDGGFRLCSVSAVLVLLSVHIIVPYVADRHIIYIICIIYAMSQRSTADWRNGTNNLEYCH